MDDTTRRRINGACTDLKRYSRWLTNPDAVTAAEVHEIVDELGPIADDLKDVAGALERDEEAEALNEALLLALKHSL
jgi:hypothetical protein